MLVIPFLLTALLLLVGALLSAFCLAGGPVPERGFCLSRGIARFKRVRLGEPESTPDSC